MARAGQGSKVIFGKYRPSAHTPMSASSKRHPSDAYLSIVPMNLGTMGAAGLNSTPQQISASEASGSNTDGRLEQQNGLAMNAGMVNAMSQL